jgi:hypothetical protein
MMTMTISQICALRTFVSFEATKENQTEKELLESFYKSLYKITDKNTLALSSFVTKFSEDNKGVTVKYLVGILQQNTDCMDFENIDAYDLIEITIADFIKQVEKTAKIIDAVVNVNNS